MSIDPRLLQAPGEIPQIYTMVSDMDRRLRMIEAARSVIGNGTITGGTGGMLGTGTITGGNVASGTITGTNLVAGTITATQIAAGTITATLIAADAINAGHIQAGAVTASEIAANTITAANIQAGTITSNEIAAGTIVASDIQASTITSNEIAANTITASDIAAGTITTTEIAANTITASDIAANTITTTEIQAATITASDIATGTITATQIATGTITGALIAGTTITAANIATNTITADRMNISTLSAITANLGTITAGTITGGTFQSSASNPKVIMDASGVRAIDSGGVVTFSADASTGKITTLAGIGGPNLLPHSSFESTIAMQGWTTDAGNAPTRATDEKFHGTASAKIVNATPNDSYFRQDITLTKTGTYKITAWIKTLNVVGGSPPTNGAKLNVDQVSGSITTTDAPALGGTNDWTRVEAKAVVNTAGSVLRIYCQLGFSTNVTGTAWFDAIQIEYGEFVTAYGPKPDEILPGTVTGNSGGAGTGQIAPGTIIGTDLLANTITATQIAASTITATQIASATITAGNIASGTLTSTQIAAGTITGDRIAGTTITAANLNVTSLSAITADLGDINAGTLTGVTLTGATIQTSAVGQRVVLDASGLIVYNASNAPIVNLPVTGAASFTGAIDADGGITQDAVVASPAISNRKHAWLDATGSEAASIFGATSAYPGTSTPRLFASATAPMSYDTLVKAHANLVHYWRMDSTTSLTDQVATSPLTLPLTYGGVLTPAASLISGTNAASTNSSVGGSGFSAAPGAAQNVTTGLSVEYWMRIDKTPVADVRLAQRSTNTDGSSTEYWKSTYIASTGKLQFSIWISGAAKTHTMNTALTTGTTYHVVHTYDGANIRSYLNAVADGTATAQTGSLDAQGTTPYRVGTIAALNPSGGPNNAGTGASVAGGGFAWSNPGNITSSNNTYAQATVTTANGLTDFLQATNFGFAVPSTATIKGVTVEVEAKASVDGGGANYMYFAGSKLIKGGTVVGVAQNASPSGHLTTSDAYYAIGSASNMWGTTLTPADVNASNFGVQVQFQVRNAVSSITGDVDHIRVTVHYWQAITLDEVAVYSAALTQGVIDDHYQTGVTGISTSAASVNKQILGADGSSDFMVTGGPAVQCAFTGGSQVINAGTSGAITFATGSEAFDQGSPAGQEMHDGTNTSRFYARRAGIYVITSSYAVIGSGTTGSPSYSYLRLNGSPSATAVFGTFYMTQAIGALSAVVKLAAGDYVEHMFNNQQASAVNATVQQASFSMVMIGG